MLLVVHNNHTDIHEADEFMLQMLNKELRYPTGLAQYQSGDLDVPTTEGWDGWVRLLRICKVKPSWFPTGLIPLVQKIGEKFDYPVDIEDRRERPPEAFPELVDIPLRDYQKEAVTRALELGRGVLDMPPRSGKTRTMCEIVRGIAQPTVWIAPTDQIVQQTHKVLRGFFGEHFASHQVGAKKYDEGLDKQVVVCTAATAAALPPDFYRTRGCIAVDEFHHGAAASYKHIFEMCDHIYYRYGMTGTFFRSGEDIMAMHSLLSNTIYKVSSLELLKLGYLVPSYVAFVPVIAPRLRGMDSTFHKGHGKHGIQEHVYRNQLVAQSAILLTKVKRKVLILVGTKVQGRLIRDILLHFIPASPENTEFKSVEFVSTDTDRPAQRRIIDSFESGQEVKVLIGTSLLGEGVDLPSTDALVYARGEQAQVGLTQSMYRVCTAVEGKKEALVIDFADRHNKKLMNHSKERLRVYHQEETFQVSVLQNQQFLRKWLDDVLLLGSQTL